MTPREVRWLCTLAFAPPVPSRAHALACLRYPPPLPTQELCFFCFATLPYFLPH
jgi:hypothetical protein